MRSTEKTLDLLAVGRASIDLYGEQIGGRLEDMGSFAKYIGGSATNTTVAAARLGLRVGLLTRVGADHMGRFIREELEREGVDVSGVKLDPDRLTALAILGIRDRENFPLLFYRENCADMALCEEDLDEALLRSAGAVLINGTHLSTPHVAAASIAAARAVKQHGGRVAFDIDYRPVLWGLTAKDLGENRFVSDSAVTRQMQVVVPLCDLIVGTEEEMQILGGSTDTLAALRDIRARTRALLVCKLGERGSAAFSGDIPADVEQGAFSPGFAVQVLNVVGAGDAFMGGFLRGWLRHEELEYCCRLGNACGALVASRHGCAPAMPSWQEVNSFLQSRSSVATPGVATPGATAPGAIIDLEHVHWATTRARDYGELAVLAIDHRVQFDEIAARSGADPARISKFKDLGLAALDNVARGDTRFGVLLDGRFGFDALCKAADLPYWIGRPIEVPRSRPLEFESSADVATELATWPLNHVVKCLVIYHPDDDLPLRERQERQLLRLFDACRKTRHELLVEVILPQDMAADVYTLARAISRIYQMGVRPDWWKLEAIASPAAWRNIQNAIVQADPLCRGVLLLGMSAPLAQLITSFATAASFPIVKGFAIGRTIFHEVACAWFAGTLSDVEAVTALAQGLSVLVQEWRSARAAVAA